MSTVYVGKSQLTKLVFLIGKKAGRQEGDDGYSLYPQSACGSR